MQVHLALMPIHALYHIRIYQRSLYGMLPHGRASYGSLGTSWLDLF